ncbi:MAG TPA: hypothetical protein VJJ22_00680 [Candidatus Paceibacterota bacterium]
MPVNEKVWDVISDLATEWFGWNFFRKGGNPPAMEPAASSAPAFDHALYLRVRRVYTMLIDTYVSINENLVQLLSDNSKLEEAVLNTCTAEATHKAANKASKVVTKKGKKSKTSQLAPSVTEVEIEKIINDLLVTAPRNPEKLDKWADALIKDLSALGEVARKAKATVVATRDKIRKVDNAIGDNAALIVGVVAIIVIAPFPIVACTIKWGVFGLVVGIVLTMTVAAGILYGVNETRRN